MHKIIQHNSADIAYNYIISIEKIQKFYKACGNCKFLKRKKIVYITLIIDNKISTLAGHNPKYGDIVFLKNVKINGGGHVSRSFQERNDDNELAGVGNRCYGTSICSYFCS